MATGQQPMQAPPPPEAPPQGDPSQGPSTGDTMTPDSSTKGEPGMPSMPSLPEGSPEEDQVAYQEALPQ